MFTLTSVQRRLLETTVIKARQLSEQGAEKALKNLAADQPEPFSHMDAEQRDLRRRLRAKARLLGDENTNGKQEIRQLSYELAYEYWHKMLFARFLEANNLLIHPEHYISVSLEECAEFAPEEGHADKWAAAAHYASHMLPAIFRPEDPLTQVDFATEDRLSLEALLEGINTDIFLATDSLGWVYQYWQSEEKAAINTSGEKIDGKRLPAVTQLFTEPYMVHFLIDNTMGAWWTSRNPFKKPPVAFEYLRRLEDGKPAASSFAGWPDRVKDITCIDPCMGSGHFIVELFLKLAPLRMQEEGLSKEEATYRVIADNLHGLEIDPRCTQIAAFNLALTAWKFCGKYIELPEMNLACSGTAPRGKKEDWVKLVSHERDSVQRARMEKGMEVLYDHFQLAPELGSLLDPTTIKADIFAAQFDELQPALLEALSIEQDKDIVERGVMAAGIAKAGLLLSKKYTLQITNVPYLSRGKQDEVMAEYASQNYPEAKGDLATVFFDKMLKNTKGTACSVMPQNWLFLTSYKKFREKLLKNHSWGVVARLGPGAFSQISGEVVKAILISIHSHKPNPDTVFYGLDVSDQNNAADKALALETAEVKTVNQKERLGNPDCVITFEKLSNLPKLSEYADSIKGTDTGDDPRFTRDFWEIHNSSFPIWMKYHTTPNGKNDFDGKNRILFWENEEGSFIHDSQGTIRRRDTLYQKAIAIRLTGKIEASLFENSLFDTNAGAIVVKKEDDLLPLYTFCRSESFRKRVRQQDQALKATNASITKVPFELEHWQKVAAEKYPNGLPKPYSDDPTQWLFHGHPKHADNPLQVVAGRLMGYRWPAESDEEMELDQNARDNIAQIREFDHLTDDDGILCIPPVNGEKPAAECLREYIKEVWQEDWGHNTLHDMLKREGSSKTNLEQWLRDEFLIQHCKVFNNRPFIWHIWDGRKDGFAALVNYHKFTNANFQKLIYTYLNDWIRQCDRKDKYGESGAGGLLIAAHQLKQKLELILAGDPPYDIFVRWKPVHEQPIGWDPDLNDGVRLNIYPFMQAGILRKNPNIKWDKDRGKNPEGSHWGPDRYNRYEDLDDRYKLKDAAGKVMPSLTNEVKRKAREKIHKSI